MLLSELEKFSARLDSTPAMYTSQPIKWLITLDLDGIQQGEIQGLYNEKNKLGLHKVIPNRKRSGKSPPPWLLADKAEYVLGLGRLECHLAFKELVATCAEITQEPSVVAIDKFLMQWDLAQSQDILPPMLEADDLVTFQVRLDGRKTIIPAEDKAGLTSVQQFWLEYLEQGKVEKQKGQPKKGWCVVTGKYGLLTQREPISIKGIPGGNPTGTSLVSANNNAFESFCLENSFTSSISQSGAEGYLKALNHLLADRKSHFRIGQEVVYCWWTREEQEFDLVNFLETPSDGQAQAEIHDLMAAALKGDRPVALELDAVEDRDRFFAIALTANNARAVVQRWIDVALPQVKYHLGRWFVGQRIVDSYGELSQPRFRLRSLAECAYREPKEMLDRTPTALFFAALEGRPLPADLLDRVVRRIRVEGGKVTHARAALIKLALTLGGKIAMNEMESLTRDPKFLEDQVGERLAYHSGRFLAQVEAVQRAALGNVNATVIDRYYGAMSANPLYMLGTLANKARANLSNLRKNKSSWYNALQGDFEEIFSKITDTDLPDLPKTLSMQEQSIFAIGYYHQRAHNSKQVRDRLAALGGSKI